MTYEQIEARTLKEVGLDPKHAYELKATAAKVITYASREDYLEVALTFQRLEDTLGVKGLALVTAYVMVFFFGMQGVPLGAQVVMGDIKVVSEDDVDPGNVQASIDAATETITIDEAEPQARAFIRFTHAVLARDFPTAVAVYEAMFDAAPTDARSMTATMLDWTTQVSGISARKPCDDSHCAIGCSIELMGRRERCMNPPTTRIQELSSGYTAVACATCVTDMRAAGFMDKKIRVVGPLGSVN